MAGGRGGSRKPRRLTDCSHKRPPDPSTAKPFHPCVPASTWTEGIVVYPVPGAGRGVVAQWDLPPGRTVLISEPWAVGVSYEDLIVGAAVKVADLPQEREGYFSDHILQLAGADDEWPGASCAVDEVLATTSKLTSSQVLRIGSIIRHNAFQDGGRSYFFTDACLFNHSCFPNCCWSISPENQKIEVMRRLSCVDSATTPSGGRADHFLSG
eukprot:GGOE01054924.1.p1 GENE.GGOE01054924.1~~GGOE01054924.1.p1  ORF type:complete len:211 (+),score=42.01 GGOE01054924.1:61-693(+)